MARKYYHSLLFGLFVFAVTYGMLIVPQTEEEAAFGGRLKYLTFIDIVNIFYWIQSLWWLLGIVKLFFQTIIKWIFFEDCFMGKYFSPATVLIANSYFKQWLLVTRKATLIITTHCLIADFYLSLTANRALRNIWHIGWISTHNVPFVLHVPHIGFRYHM